MLKLDYKQHSIARTYPKNPMLGETRRSRAKPGTNYVTVDLAMRAPVSILNEELSISTVASCEFHPRFLDSRLYAPCQNRWHERYYTHRVPYRSFIALDLENYKRVEALRKYLTGVGFYTDCEYSYHGSFDAIDMDDEEAAIHLCKGLKAEFPMGILGFRYPSNKDGMPENGQCSIDATPFERQNIGQWKEWDRIRDEGWGHWLELLYRFTITEK